MSAESYNHWWILTKDQLKNLKDADNLTTTTTKPIKDRVRATYVVSKLFVKYTSVVKNLAKCLYQLAQVSKRLHRFLIAIRIKSRCKGTRPSGS